jgi:hypothetical protein
MRVRVPGLICDRVTAYRRQLQTQSDRLLIVNDRQQRYHSSGNVLMVRAAFRTVDGTSLTSTLLYSMGYEPKAPVTQRATAKLRQ